MKRKRFVSGPRAAGRHAGLTALGVLLCSSATTIGGLQASTFIGAGSWSDDEAVSGIAIGRSNKVYVVGWVETPAGFPTVEGCFQTSFGGGSYDAFVSRFNADLTTLEASTYLGGSGQDVARAIAIDAEGHVYVVGDTASADFPTTAGAFSNTLHAGSYDAFVCKLDAGLTRLLAGTLLGGSHADGAYAVALGPTNVYVAGLSWYRNDFPTTPGAHSAVSGGDSDAFVACFDTNLSTLAASTLIGGHYEDYCRGVAVDAAGNIFIAGHSESAPNLLPPAFPVTTGAYDTNWHNGSVTPLWQGFVCKLAPDASLIASTLLGGYYEEEIHALALGADDTVYVGGHTGSGDFPTTPAAFSTSNQSAKEAFVSRFDPALSNLMASTYLGGGNDDRILALDAGPLGVAVAGYTRADDFPTTPGAYQPEREGSEDVFVSRLSHDLAHLRASTYLGSTKNERMYAITFGTGAMPPVYAAGYSNYRFPATPEAFAVSYGSYGGDEGIVCKLDALFARMDDQDDDGMPDWWETSHSGSATGLAAGLDYDLDGMTNAAEFVAGTDPRTNASAFRIETMRPDGSPGIVIGFNAADGRLYRIETSGTLTNGIWQPLAVDLPGTGDPVSAIDTNAPAGAFYKASVTLPGY